MKRQSYDDRVYFFVDSSDDEKEEKPPSAPPLAPAPLPAAAPGLPLPAAAPGLPLPAAPPPPTPSLPAPAPPLSRHNRAMAIFNELHSRFPAFPGNFTWIGQSGKKFLHQLEEMVSLPIEAVKLHLVGTLMLSSENYSHMLFMLGIMTGR